MLLTAINYERGVRSLIPSNLNLETSRNPLGSILLLQGLPGGTGITALLFIGINLLFWIPIRPPMKLKPGERILIER